MINKNSEIDIGVQSKDQKNKTASHWLLPQPQFKNGDPASRKPQNETESCLFLFYNPL